MMLPGSNGCLSALYHTDPHNNGTYTVLSDSGTAVNLQRRTGDDKYTDLMTFTFANASDTSCTFYACSESQTTSVADFSTNYCNLRNLYCRSPTTRAPVSSTTRAVSIDMAYCLTCAGGSDMGCKFVTKDISIKETEVRDRLEGLPVSHG